MTEPRVVIVGGGHNGLVAAFYLARAGAKPLVLERRAIVGGAAVTEEILPGFKCSTLAHAAGPLAPEVASEMGLARQGLEFIKPSVEVFAPTSEGRALEISADARRSAESFAAFSKNDAEKFAEFQTVLGRLAKVIRRLMVDPPPAVEAPVGDVWNMLGAAKDLRSLGEKDMHRLLAWGPRPVADLVMEWFETEPVRAVIAARGIFGNFLAPRSAGSTATLVARAALDSNPAGCAVFVKGGAGALPEAMARAATEAGAEIRTGAEVSQITVEDGRVRGVLLASGEEIPARAVISNADPKRTFLTLLDPSHLDPDFLVRIANYRSSGSVGKINLALGALPAFAALGARARPSEALSGRILIAPSLDYLERAFDDAKYGRFSRQPFLEVTIPSLTDSTLAPPGKHVMSIVAQFAPYRLREGDWTSRREEWADSVIRTLSGYSPDLAGSILHRQSITPRDLEETYALTGGHPFHGELALDQLFSLRPMLGWARYRTPIKGLYLCGSGTHPGTGLNGLSGRNAAHEILKDLRKR